MLEAHELTSFEFLDRLGADTPLCLPHEYMKILTIIEDVVFEILELVGVAHDTAGDIYFVLISGMHVVGIGRQIIEGAFVMILHREEDGRVGVSLAREYMICLVAVLILTVSVDTIVIMLIKSPDIMEKRGDLAFFAQGAVYVPELLGRREDLLCTEKYRVDMTYLVGDPRVDHGRVGALDIPVVVGDEDFGGCGEAVLIHRC